MRLYYVYFLGTRQRTAIQAKTRKEAIALFAALHSVPVSQYIVTSKNP